MCLFSDCDINIYPISNAITSFFYCVFNLIIKMLIDITSSCFFFQGHHLQQLESLRLSFTRFLQLIISIFMVYIHIIYCFNRHYLWDLSEQRLSETSLLWFFFFLHTHISLVVFRDINFSTQKHKEYPRKVSFNYGIIFKILKSPVLLPDTSPSALGRTNTFLAKYPPIFFCVSLQY